MTEVQKGHMIEVRSPPTIKLKSARTIESRSVPTIKLKSARMIESRSVRMIGDLIVPMIGVRSARMISARLGDQPIESRNDHTTGDPSARTIGGQLGRTIEGWRIRMIGALIVPSVRTTGDPSARTIGALLIHRGH